MQRYANTILGRSPLPVFNTAEPPIAAVKTLVPRPSVPVTQEGVMTDLDAALARSGAIMAERNDQP